MKRLLKGQDGFIVLAGIICLSMVGAAHIKWQTEHPTEIHDRLLETMRTCIYDGPRTVYVQPSLECPPALTNPGGGLLSLEYSYPAGSFHVVPGMQVLVRGKAVEVPR